MLLDEEELVEEYRQDLTFQALIELQKEQKAELIKVI